MQFEAAKINKNLRGKVFLFTDALLSRVYEEGFPQAQDINAGLEYLQKFITFALTYLRNFPKHFFHVFSFYELIQSHFCHSLQKDGIMDNWLLQNLKWHILFIFLSVYCLLVEYSVELKDVPDSINKFAE